MQISEADIQRVTDAVGAAEACTDGEIATIVAGRSDSYHDVALVWSLLVGLLALAALAAFPDFYIGLFDRMSGGWEHVWTHRELLTGAFIVVLIKAGAMRALLLWQPLLLALTPRKVKAARVRARAILLFKAGTERRTHTRTGVLLYLSMAEHQAEIVADEAIAAKVMPEAWGEAMAALIGHLREGRVGEGMASAVTAVGNILAAHFPYSGEDPDEMSNRMITL